MANVFFLRPFFLFLLFCFQIHQAFSNDRKTYIVYMGDHPKGIDPAILPSIHTTMTQNVLGSYKKSFNGFVVKLTEDEAETLAEMENVVSVFRNTKHYPSTTKSWDYVGLPQNSKRMPLENDIIVGVIDSGIWPKSKSFSDEGFGPPPKKWKGSCHNFTCNNKLIGARYFNIEGSYSKKDIKDPTDVNGHGTHCSSIVAGNSVNSVSLQGFASGTARGGVPSARIAMYKVCWETGCDQAGILAAFDEAIADGVDVISLSVGSSQVKVIPYFQNSIDIGSFHAMKRGIFTANAANNLGPNILTMTNFAPWLLSVAASTFDRKFVTKVQLGNGAIYEGTTINTFDLKRKMFPIIFARDIPNTAGGFNSSESRSCIKDSVDKQAVKGKIVLCEGYQIASDVGFFSGAVGVIFGRTYPQDSPFIFALPATLLSLWNLREIQYYMKSTRNPTATIFKSEEVEDLLSPYVASFSSRGPNPITPNILKPDIAAPGVNVLAAWTPLDPISKFEDDNRRLPYQILSGTSMACPHAAGAAAYVKSFHPNWSPAMIKSALMTTATPMSSNINAEAEFAYGAGLINPVKAANPGLVYDISEADYAEFLCGEGYTSKELRILTQDKSNCKGKDNEKVVYSLNLPSFALNVNGKFFGYAYHRTVTNVGSANSTYKARIISSSLLEIQVKPDVLSFTSIGQKKSFSLTIEGRTNVQVMSSALIWDDGNHQVRSPIVVYGDGS
ncbi:cucumisin-like isoform X2 [Vicia villosa]|uniref:cucumisin-like isoform X2 n=1 Tax=Vicia villosa TaxID=3911 RepID=UPI00273BA942|nr:cucumisin-like isoform X2 [Vicia villosa]